MRIKTRFALHLIFGVVLWILGASISMLIILEAILPLLHVAVGESTEGLLAAWIFGASTLFIIGYFGWYFAGPLAFIMGWIYQLSQGLYIQPAGMKKIYSRKGKLRMRYLLYQEVLESLQSLAGQLQANEIERQKIEKAKQDWIAGISHDLKTPLTYITGYTTLLLNDQYEWSKEEASSFIQEVHDKGAHMEALIKDLSLVLQFNDPRHTLPIHRQNQDLVEFTKRAAADISNNPQAAGHRLHVETDAQDIYIEFDETLLRRVYQNILMNAILHNPDPVDIHIQLDDCGEHVRIRLTDNGVGMPRDTLENLFQQYYRGTTTDAASEGTGLGMAIVYNLVRAHGGTITAESEPSKGTSFEIQLPKQRRLQDHES